MNLDIVILEYDHDVFSNMVLSSTFELQQEPMRFILMHQAGSVFVR